jgi:adenylyl-sulfate kinase
MTHAQTLWLTGLSASGKSTLAEALTAWFREQGRAACLLDGDRLRVGLSEGLGFSHADRTENIRRAAEVARLLNENGIVAIAALVSPKLSDRELARDVIGIDHYREVYVSTPLEVCEARDPKGLYRRARCGDLKEFTGITSAYEPPSKPNLAIDTSCLSVDQSLAMCLRFLDGYAHS